MASSAHAYLEGLWRAAHRRNTDNILELLEPDPAAALLDLGCDDGVLTLEFARRVGTTQIHGCDLPGDGLEEAAKRGVQTTGADLNRRLPYDDSSFDVVTSNQVIEHLVDTDGFVEEIHRVLRPGGYAIVSTENLSSWHNIFALALGRPAFSQHVSTRRVIGNPMALLSGEEIRPGFFHIKVFTLVGLKALMRLYDLEIEEGRGAGYYPLPPRVADTVSGLSPGHSAFIAVKGRKRAETVRVGAVDSAAGLPAGEPEPLRG